MKRATEDQRITVMLGDVEGTADFSVPGQVIVRWPKHPGFYTKQRFQQLLDDGCLRLMN